MKILVTGDSHVRYFCDGIPPSDQVKKITLDDHELTVYKVGSSGATMHGLKNEKSATGARRKILELVGKEKFDTIALSFGEVDCRIHSKDNSTGKFFDDLLEIYAEFIGVLKDKVENVCVIDLPPYHPRAVFSYGDVGLSAYFSNTYLSMKLEEFAEKNGLGFLSPRHLLIKDDGFLKEEFFQTGDKFHLKIDEAKTHYRHHLLCVV